MVPSVTSSGAPAGGTGLLAATASATRAAARTRRGPRPPAPERRSRSISPGARTRDGRRGLLGVGRPGDQAAGQDRAAGHPGRAAAVHRRAQRRDGMDLSRAGRRAAARRQLSAHGDRRQRRQRRRPVQRRLPHRAGRPAAFRFTSFGDLATPNTAWVRSYGQTPTQSTRSNLQPLFHLLNGDLRYADLNPATQPEVWRDFGNNNQASAANRPCAVPGQPRGGVRQRAAGPSYPTRYTLPDNHVPASAGAGTASGSARSCSSPSTPTTSSTRTRARSWPARRR